MEDLFHRHVHWFAAVGEGVGDALEAGLLAIRGGRIHPEYYFQVSFRERSAAFINRPMLHGLLILRDRGGVIRLVFSMYPSFDTV